MGAAAIRISALAAAGAGILLSPAPQGAHSLDPPRELRREGARVPGRVAGRITDHITRKPISRALVSLRNPEIGLALDTLSDESGTFEFMSLLPARYALMASHAGYVSTTYGATSPGRPGVRLALASPEDQVTVDFSLLPGATITGLVLADDGVPVPGVQVRALLRVRDPKSGMMRFKAGSDDVLSDGRGRYRLSGLSPGDYYLQTLFGRFVVGPGQVRQVTKSEADWAIEQARNTGLTGSAALGPQPVFGPTVFLPPTYFPGGSDVGSAREIRVGVGEEVTGVDVRLKYVPASRIIGRVVGNTAPLTALQVQVIPRTAVGGLPFDGTAATPVASDGRFTLAGVVDGDYTLLVGPRPDANGWHPGNRAEYSISQISISGADVSVDIPIRAGGTVSGAVTIAASSNKSNSGLAGFQIQLHAQPPLPAQLRWSVHAGSDGAFRIAGVPAGLYELKVVGPAGGGWVRTTWSVGQRELAGSWLDVPGGGVSGLSLQMTDRSSSVAGRVVDKANHPATDYVVILFPATQERVSLRSEGIRAARPAANGTYRFAELPSGAYMLAAVADVEEDEWLDPAFLAKLAGGAYRFVLAEGENTVRDLRVLR